MGEYGSSVVMIILMKCGMAQIDRDLICWPPLALYRIRIEIYIKIECKALVPASGDLITFFGLV